VLVDLNPSYVDKEHLLPTIMSEVSQTTIENKQTSNQKLHKVESKKFDIAPISIVREKKKISSFGDLLTEHKRASALQSIVNTKDKRLKTNELA